MQFELLNGMNLNWRSRETTTEIIQNKLLILVEIMQELLHV